MDLCIGIGFGAGSIALVRCQGLHRLPRLRKVFFSCKLVVSGYTTMVYLYFSYVNKQEFALFRLLL